MLHFTKEKSKQALEKKGERLTRRYDAILESTWGFYIHDSRNKQKKTNGTQYYQTNRQMDPNLSLRLSLWGIKKWRDQKRRQKTDFTLQGHTCMR